MADAGGTYERGKGEFMNWYLLVMALILAGAIIIITLIQAVLDGKSDSEGIKRELRDLEREDRDD